MKFLGGFLKFLSILLMLIGTVAGTALVFLGITDDMIEPILVGVGVFLAFLFVGLGVIGTGVALSQIVKLKKRVSQLEQRLWSAPAPAAPATVPVSAEPAADPIAEILAPAPAAAEKKRKVWIPVVIVSVLVVAGVVCALLLPKGKEDDAPVPDSLTETAPEAVPETTAAAESCPITVNGFCVDDSYVDDDGSPLKMVYLFYTMTADSSNLEIDSKYTKMYIGDNMYEADHFADESAACEYTPNYYYGSYIKDVYVGESVNVVATFYVPAGDLESGSEVRLEDTQIPDAETLSFSTGDFQHFGSPEEIAMCMDPEGYEHTMFLYEEADDARAEEVRSLLNGYQWTFYVNNLAYELEFWSYDNFSVTTAFGEQTGTYSVRNGYVFCTYPSTNYTVKIPYEIVNGEMDLDTIAGFDVRVN